MDLVSIITPLYNAELWIRETASSVLSQTHQNWEWIIVDDCSSDSSLAIVRELASADRRIVVLQNERNLRTAQTRNRGIRGARGRFVAFLDSDDIWHPQKLERQIEFMKMTDAALSFHAYRKFRGDLSTAGIVIHGPSKVSYRELLRTNVIACLSAMYDASKLGKVEMPDGYKAREDYLTWLKILRTTGGFAYGMHDCLGYYRIVGTSYSAKKVEMAKLQWRLYREVEQLGYFDATVSFMFYMLHGYLKAKVL